MEELRQDAKISEILALFQLDTMGEAGPLIWLDWRPSGAAAASTQLSNCGSVCVRSFGSSGPCLFIRRSRWPALQFIYSNVYSNIYSNKRLSFILFCLFHWRRFPPAPA